MVNPLVEWAVEREKIRKAKEAGLPPPWTNDPILQTYRFCNLRRRDDRVSRWLRSYVVTDNHLQRGGFANFILFTAFCRWNNWPPTIAEILNRGFWFWGEYPLEKIDWGGIVKFLDELKGQKRKAWTSAYMIRADNRIKGASKGQFIVDTVRGLEPLLLDIEKAIKTGLRREVWLTLMKAHSFGSFMSGQIVDDWTWGSLLKDAKDLYTWAPMGPGSIRGFNRLLGRPLNKRPSEEEFCEHLQVWRKEIIEALGPEYETLTAHDCQNALCETDKMLRVKNGEGRPRSKYRPETAYGV